MNLTRREMGRAALAITAVAIAARAAPVMAAEDQAVTEAIMAFTGGATPEEGGLDVGAPEIAENGNTVPLEGEAEGATDVLILAAGNPNPGVATIHFGALSASPVAKTRIRLAKTQDVIAVAKMSDGSFRQSARTIKVTIGGCGG